MKEIYPEYRKVGITTEKLYSNLKRNEKEVFDNFLKTIAVGENKLKDIRTAILQFLDIIEKPLNELNLQDVKEYNAILVKSGRTPYTINGVKVHVKRFLKYVFKDWFVRFDELKDFRQVRKAFNNKKINEETLLKKDEIEGLIRACDSIREKALMMLLIESGARPIEIRTLRWSDVKLGEPLTEIKIYSDKNREFRKTFVNQSTIHLKRWKQEFSFPNRKESDLVFPSPRNRDKPYSRGAITLWFKSIAKKSGIERDVFPYLARHTLATELYKKLPGVKASKIMGHSQDMSKIYTHLSSDDLKEALLSQIYNIQEITPEKKHELEIKVEKQEELIKKLQKQIENNQSEIRNLIIKELKKIKH